MLAINFKALYFSLMRLYKSIALISFLALLTSCADQTTSESISEEDKKAFLEIEESANSGNKEAEYQLALKYYEGVGVEKNIPSAINWLEKAANQDLLKAEYALGVIYGQGEIVSQDKAKATTWLLKAADGGFSEAEFIVGLSYSPEVNLPLDSVSKKNNKLVILVNALEIRKDPTVAYAWLKLASNNGVSAADLTLHELALTLNKDQLEIAEGKYKELVKLTHADFKKAQSIPGAILDLE